jgi:hypothetical protein
MEVKEIKKIKYYLIQICFMQYIYYKLYVV